MFAITLNDTFVFGEPRGEKNKPTPNVNSVQM